MNTKKRFSVKLQQLREQKKLTQQEFSIMAGMDRTSYNRLESGKVNVSMETIEKVCRALEVSIAEFFNDDLFANVKE